MARSGNVAPAVRGRESEAQADGRPARRRRALPELDRLIHERVRLAIVSALAAKDALPFVELRRLVGATDGNLSVHARKLEKAGYIACTKSFAGRSPRTEFRLTQHGRRAFERYLEHLAALIRHARSG